MIVTSVTGHTIDHSFALAVYQVEDRHYSKSCAKHFTTVANSWGIYDKVTTLATDNARNVTAVITMLQFELVLLKVFSYESGRYLTKLV